MVRLTRNRSQLGDVILKSDTDRPIPLRLDTKRKGFAIRTTWLPNDPGDGGPVGLREWFWQNGPGGAGTSVETPASYGNGACDHGEFAWLRRLGVAQPAGVLTELDVPALAAGQTSGRFTCGRVFGSGNDLFITTRNRSIVKVAGGTGATAPSEQDCGVGSVTAGCAVFAGSGSSKLYVGDTQRGIWAYDGASWTSGEAGTERAFLETPYWTLGDALATGGLAGSAGNGHDILVGTNATGTGFYHVAGDPQTAANWGALTKVGTGGSQFPIASTVASNRVVWFANGLGVWGTDEVGHSPNFTKFVELIASSATGLTVAYWADLIWLATEQGLVMIDPSGKRIDLARFIQFGAQGVSPIYGRPRALAPCEDGLYVAYFNEQTLVSYVGILLLDDSGSFRWSMAEAVIQGEQVDYLQQVSGSDGNPRLFIGTRDGTGGLHLYWQSQPVSGDPESDYLHGGPFRAAPEWSLTLSRFNGRRAVPNMFRRFMLEADRLGSDFPANTVEVQTSLDGGAYTVQGTATRATRWSGQPRSGNVRAVSAQIKLVCHNTTTQPLAVRSVAARYSPRPELTKVTTYPVIIGEKISGQDPGVILARLEQAQEDADPFAAIDHFGRKIECMVEPPTTEDTVEEVTDGDWTVHASVTISQTRRVARFNAGDTFNTGSAFS